MPSSRRGPAACRIAGWSAGAWRKTKPVVPRHAPRTAAGSSSRTPSASSTSAPPTAPETARLPCLATGTPAAAATRPAAVETLSVAAPSPPVPQVSIASAGTSGMGTAWARSTRAAPASSATASPFMWSATSRPAVCAGLASPERISSTHVAISISERSWPSTTRAIASRSGTALASGGPCRLAAAQAGEEVAEQPLALGGEDRLGVELHPLHEERAVPDAHDLVVGGPRRALELGRQRRRVDHQRVVARRREALREAREQPAPVVQDGRGLAVHDAPGTHDRAAEGGADRLVPEADAEDGEPAREALDERHRDARLARRAWPGRDHDAVGAERRHLLQRDGIVAPHVDLGAELAQVLDEVVGEGVVVVDHEEPQRRHQRASASRTAWIMARDLLTHSRCSASGSESATMPAPAWMYTRPPRKRTNRIVIAVSIAPENAKYPTAPPYAPRRTGSSSSMISMARILGAPESVPAGKVARKASKQSRPGASVPRTLETRCMTCE